MSERLTCEVPGQVLGRPAKPAGPDTRPVRAGILWWKRAALFAMMRQRAAKRYGMPPRAGAETARLGR